MEASVTSSAAPRPVRRPARLLRLAGDERLVADVRAGSDQAFEALYDRHHRGVLGFCRHMLGSYEEAEDAVQHTFMAAYRAMLASEKPIAFKAWLFTIARNRCLSVLRARREHPSDRLEELSTVGLAVEVEQREDLRLLLRDVASLPEDQRAALVLAEVGDVSHDEIAEILGCPRPKVKALVFQARSSLAAARLARETPCPEIQEQLANLRGGSLRRTNLRRHLRECAGCQVFRAELETQRRGLALVLPVIPALGLKAHVLAAVAGGGGAAGGGSAIVAAGGTGAGALAAKALVVLAVAGGGTAGVATVTGGGDGSKAERSAAGGRPGAAGPGSGGAAATGALTPAVLGSTGTNGREPRAPRDDAQGAASRSAAGLARGSGPASGPATGDRERDRSERAKKLRKTRKAKKVKAKRSPGARRPVARNKPARVRSDSGDGGSKRKPAEDPPVSVPAPAVTPVPTVAPPPVDPEPAPEVRDKPERPKTDGG